MRIATRATRWVGFAAGVIALLAGSPALPQQDPTVLFAVVTKAPKDRSRVTAQVSDGGPSAEVVLIPSESVVENLIWKKLEVCHSLRLEGWKNQEGYRIVAVKVLDAGMLPMTLQSIAGDCLIKRALEYAPLVD
ncbi:MAG: hypothetical protein EPO64_08535 [Nitrospirae bacterium]|nr:MAG: hypothetical protein EPO64_08535 [Nitrospirota bacterium]